MSDGNQQPVAEAGDDDQLPVEAVNASGGASDAAGEVVVRRASRVLARQMRSVFMPAEQYAAYVSAHPPAGDRVLDIVATSVKAADERSAERQRLEHRTFDKALVFVFVLALVALVMLAALAFYLIYRGEIVIGTLVGVGEGAALAVLGVVAAWLRRTPRRRVPTDVSRALEVAAEPSDS